MNPARKKSDHTRMSPEDALRELRALHRNYVRRCGSRFRDVPFSARNVPGWTYDPKTDTVLERPW